MKGLKSLRRYTRLNCDDRVARAVLDFVCQMSCDCSCYSNDVSSAHWTLRKQLTGDGETAEADCDGQKRDRGCRALRVTHSQQEHSFHAET